MLERELYFAGEQSGPPSSVLSFDIFFFLSVHSIIVVQPLEPVHGRLQPGEDGPALPPGGESPLRRERRLAPAQDGVPVAGGGEEDGAVGRHGQGGRPGRGAQVEDVHLNRVAKKTRKGYFH